MVVSVSPEKFMVRPEPFYDPLIESELTFMKLELNSNDFDALLRLIERRDELAAYLNPTDAREQVRLMSALEALGEALLEVESENDLEG